MDTEILVRYILLGMGSVIILFILWDGLRRKKRRLAVEPDRHSVHDQVFREVILGIDPVFSERFEEKIDEPIEEVMETPIEEEAEMEEEITTEEIESEVPEEAIEPEEACIEEEVVEEPPEEIIAEELVAPESKRPKYVMIFLMALPNKPFSGYRLLQALLANDLHYGEMRVFHRYSAIGRPTGKKLFSVASAMEPGDFDLARIGELKCTGLVFFMNVADHKNSEEVFEAMLATAVRLNKELGGELKTRKREPWTITVTQAIREALR